MPNSATAVIAPTALTERPHLLDVEGEGLPEAHEDGDGGDAGSVRRRPEHEPGHADADPRGRDRCDDAGEPAPERGAPALRIRLPPALDRRRRAPCGRGRLLHLRLAR